MITTKPPARYLPTLTEVIRPSQDRPLNPVSTANTPIASATAVSQQVHDALEQFESNLRSVLQHELNQTLEKVALELQTQIDTAVTQELERFKQALFPGDHERDAV